LSKHPSQPSNPDIAKTLFLAGKIESWGRGIDLIRNACTADGCPAPRFASDSTGVEVVFPFAAVETSVKTLVKTPVETPTKTPIETLMKTPIEILKRLKETPTLTVVQLADALGKSPSAIHRASAKLVQEGKLRYVGPRKGGHWEILK
jgi:ATP-dependent DNA helicase RecG